MHGTVRKFIAVGTMAFAASSSMVGTASAAKAPKPPKPIKVSEAIKLQAYERNEAVGTVKLEYVGNEVTLKSVSVKAVKGRPVLTPGVDYEIVLRLDGHRVAFCPFKALKNGTAVMCAKAKKNAKPETSATDNLVAANYAGAADVVFGIWRAGNTDYFPEVGVDLK